MLSSRIFYDELAIPEEYWRAEMGVELQTLQRTVQLAVRAQLPTTCIGLVIAFAVVATVFVMYAKCEAPKYGRP